MTESCRRGDLVIDVGANIGILTLLFARTVGEGGAVWAFEPNPHTHSQLVENLALNGCSNVHAVQSLVADHAGVSEFFIAPWGDFNPMSAMVAHDPRARKTYLPTLTLDDLIPHVDRVNYVKIDVEGAELRVLRGASALLSRFRPLVQIEMHGMYIASFGDSVEGVFEFMEGLGYSAVNVIDGCVTTVAEFTRDTKLHVPHPLNGSDLAYQGYGQLLFLPGASHPRCDEEPLISSKGLA